MIPVPLFVFLFFHMNNGKLDFILGNLLGIISKE